MTQAQKFRNTPALLEEGFLEECKANGVVKVTQEHFERILLAECEKAGECSNTIGMLCQLEVFEDYNYGYVFDGQYFIANSFVALHAII